MRPLSEKVVVGYLSPGLVHSGFAESMLDLMVYDTALHDRFGGVMAFNDDRTSDEL